MLRQADVLGPLLGLCMSYESLNKFHPTYITLKISALEAARLERRAWHVGAHQHVNVTPSCPAVVTPACRGIRGRK